MILSIAPSVSAQSIDCSQSVPIEEAHKCFTTQENSENLTSEDMEETASPKEENSDAGLFYEDLIIIAVKGCKMFRAGDYTNAQIKNSIRYQIAESLMVDTDGGAYIKGVANTIANSMTDKVFNVSKAMHIHEEKCISPL